MRNGRKLLAATVIACLAAPGVSGGVPEDPRRTPVVTAVELVAPAVVNIRATEPVQRDGQFPFFTDPFFDEFFERRFDRRPGRGSPEPSLGSGVLVTREGYVLTNNHLIDRAQKIAVITAAGGEYEARVVGTAPRFDLAVLKIESDQDCPQAPLGDSSDLLPGETVIAIGNPFGLSNSVTTGVISALRRSVKVSEEAVFDDFIQTDASINPGNSGGPLVNLLGQVIGINTAIYRGGEGIGFAIPINTARRIMRELIEHGTVRRGWFGFFVQALDATLRESLGHTSPGGVLVTGVPIAEAGDVRVGDILTGFDGHEVRNVEHFVELVARCIPGDEVELVLSRNGDRRVSKGVCRRLTRGEADRFVWDLLGVELGTVARGGGMRVDRVRRSSYAEKIGLRPGDVVLEIREEALGGEEDLLQAVTSVLNLRLVPVTLRRGANLYSISFPVNI